MILDGVFNHTGSQSRYFNADGFYPSDTGAAQSPGLPLLRLVQLPSAGPQDYDSWWGIRTLPAVREECAELSWISSSERQDSMVRHWLRAGASGWRLDVADELPDWFHREDPHRHGGDGRRTASCIGEVWEDATNKIAYSQRRRYLLGSELHGVMNYPFRTALLAYLQGGGRR